MISYFHSEKACYNFELFHARSWVVCTLHFLFYIKNLDTTATYETKGACFDLILLLEEVLRSTECFLMF